MALSNMNSSINGLERMIVTPVGNDNTKYKPRDYGDLELLTSRNIITSALESEIKANKNITKIFYISTFVFVDDVIITASQGEVNYNVLKRKMK